MKVIEIIKWQERFGSKNYLKNMVEFRWHGRGGQGA